MSLEHFSTSRSFRIHTLKTVLRPVDTGRMSTPEVVALCESAVPDCMIDEIVQALQEVAEEHQLEADQLMSRGDGKP